MEGEQRTQMLELVSRNYSSEMTHTFLMSNCCLQSLTIHLLSLQHLGVKLLTAPAVISVSTHEAKPLPIPSIQEHSLGAIMAQREAPSFPQSAVLPSTLCQNQHRGSESHPTAPQHDTHSQFTFTAAQVCCRPLENSRSEEGKEEVRAGLLKPSCWDGNAK